MSRDPIEEIADRLIDAVATVQLELRVAEDVLLDDVHSRSRTALTDALRDLIRLAKEA